VSGQHGDVPVEVTGDLGELLAQVAYRESAGPRLRVGGLCPL
jgi:hypothetical protein